MRLAATAVMLVAWLAAMPQLALNGIQPVRDTRYGWLLMPLTAEQWGNDYSPEVSLEGTTWIKAFVNDVEVDGTAMDLGVANSENHPTVALVDLNDDTTHLTLHFTTLPVVEVEGNVTNDYSLGTVRLLAPGEQSTGLMTARLKHRGGVTNLDGRHKRNYAIKFVYSSSTDTKQDRQLLDMREDNSWILDAGQVDMSRVRNRIATDLWNDYASKPYYYNEDERACSGNHGRPVEVMVGGEYQGIYHLCEAMDRKQLRLKKYDEKKGVIRGSLWKTSAWNNVVLMREITEEPDNSQPTWCDIEVKYPDFDEVNPTTYKVLRDGIEWIIGSSEEDFENYLENHFDLPVLIDYFLLCDALNAHDNMGKNIYWAVWDQTMDRKLTLAVWDLDVTCGQNWSDEKEFYRNDEMSPNFYANSNVFLYHLFRPMYRMARNKVLKAQIDARYAELRQGVFATDQLVERYSTAINRLIDCGAADRDSLRWSGDSDIGRLTLDLAAERDYIAQWLYKRMLMMDRWHGVTPAADVNNDRAVTAADLATIVLVIAGHDDSEQGINTMLADVNYDGAVNASDLSMVVNHLAGLPPE